MEDATAGRARYLPFVDGLRAIAILAVVAYHAFPDAVTGGFTGVDVFFVVSGFLISGIVWRALDGDGLRLTTFYARRVRRLFPALALVLAVVLGLGWLLLLPTDYANLGKHVAASSAFISNVTAWSEAGYFDRAAELKPLLHLWSLAIEEQFYLAWPLLLLAARRARTAFVLAVLAGSFATNVFVVREHPDAAFFLPFGRAWELALGAATLRLVDARASRGVREVAAVAGVAAVLGSFFVVTRLDPFPGWIALLPTFGTALVLFGGADTWLARHVLALRPLVGVGLVSYPLYLWHWPLLSFARHLSIGTAAIELRVGALVVAAGLATATYLLVERRIQRTRVTFTLVAVVGALGGVGLLVMRARGLPARMPESLRTFVTIPYDMNADVNMACWLANGQTRYPRECLDAGKPGPLLVLWGDSHAARLAPGLRRFLGDGARLAQLTRSSCPPIVRPRDARCAEANDDALRAIRETRPETVLMFATWRADDWTPELLVRTLHDVLAAGAAKIVVLGPAPQWRDDLPKLLAIASFRDVPQRRVPRRMSFGLEPSVVSVDGELARAVKSVEGVSYVSLRELLCDDAGCLTRVADESDGLVTWDYGHFTTKGATHAVRAIASARPDVFQR